MSETTEPKAEQKQAPAKDAKPKLNKDGNEPGKPVSFAEIQAHLKKQRGQ
ncbi:MAG: hypothetical protein AAF556_03285 [Pseudomonadota bacterium]